MYGGSKLVSLPSPRKSGIPDQVRDDEINVANFGFE